MLRGGADVLSARRRAAAVLLRCLLQKMEQVVRKKHIIDSKWIARGEKGTCAAAILARVH